MLTYILHIAGMLSRQGTISSSDVYVDLWNSTEHVLFSELVQVQLMYETISSSNVYVDLWSSTQHVLSSELMQVQLMYVVLRLKTR